MVHGFSCSMACGALPGPGIESQSPALAGESYPLHHQGSPISLFSIRQLLIHVAMKRRSKGGSWRRKRAPDLF